jgi:hypothetical protein
MHLAVYSFNKVEKQSLTLFAGDLPLEANILVLSKLLPRHFNKDISSSQCLTILLYYSSQVEEWNS